MKKLKWEKIGIVGVDAGMLCIMDPCYAFGGSADHESEADRAFGNDWGEFLLRQSSPESDDLKHQIQYAAGGDGFGVVASTAHGDGCFSVYALKEGKGDRALAMLVVTGYSDSLPAEIRELIRKEKGYAK